VCGSQYGRVFMTWDWEIDMQNVAELADGTLVTVVPLCQGDRWENWIFGGLNASMSSMNAFASTDQGATWGWRGTVANAADYPESSSGPQSETDVVALADGETLLSVIRMDGDGPCHGSAPRTEGGTYRYYYETYSQDGGRTWTKAVPMTRDRAGCVWPRLLTLGKSAAPPSTDVDAAAAADNGPVLLSGGRLCNEGITGLFLWANEGMARTPGTPNANLSTPVWKRISISAAHNAVWGGDPARCPPCPSLSLSLSTLSNQLPVSAQRSVATLPFVG
jgi:hypothetical protein